MTARRLLASLLATSPVLLAGAARAQSPCFDPEAVPPWQALAVGDATLGAARPEGPPDGAAVALCAEATGFTATRDDFEALVQGADHLFELEATLEELAPGGEAGLVLTRDPRRPEAASLHLVARRDLDGNINLHAAFRPMEGAASTPLDSEPVPVDLPVTLRLWREAGVAHTALVTDGGLETVLSVPLAGTDLEPKGSAGLAAASGLAEGAVTARFSRPFFSTLFDPPPELACLDAAVIPSAGTTITLAGGGLERTTGAAFGGVEAEVLRVSADSATLALPALPPGSVADLDLVLDRRHRDPRAFVVGGRPVVRGDLDLDLDVDGNDLNMLRAWVRGTGPAAACAVTADVNGDGRVDAADVSHLSAFLKRGRPAPVGPFPLPGLVVGAEACDPTPGPVVSALLDAAGRAPRSLAEGDVVRIEGQHLPTRGVVRFGPVRGRIHADSTPESLIVRLGPVPAAGTHCLVLQDVEPGETTAFGRSFGEPAAARPDLCLALRASDLDAASVAVGGVDGSFFLPLPADRFDPARELNLDLNLAWPRLEGRSRGARTARLRVAPHPEIRTYDAWLARVAKVAAEGLGEGDTCGCEVVVQPMPSSQGLWIAPCADPPPPPPADPTPFSPDLPVKPVKPSLTGGTGWITQKPKSCEDLHDKNSDLRLWAWCQFQDVTRTKVEFDEPWWDVEQYLGLPIWESFRPLSAILPVWWLEEDEPGWVIDPRDMPVQMKGIMVEPALYYALNDRGYFNPCKMAARAHYCHNAQAGWMPRLPDGQRVVKTFFVPEGRLPQGVNLADYYSYQPPGEARQYLVGMHVAISHPQNFGGGSYFEWATFWVPPPANATQTRDGTPLDLVYNPVCSGGGGGDRPVELAGTPWGRFSMCIEGDGTGPCGNPWGPKNECVAAPGTNLGCEGCHSQPLGGGTFEWTGGAAPGEGEMNPAWLAFLAGQAPAARECMDYILAKEAANHPVYESLVECDGF
ncbi:MAG: hypothetical protein R3F60_18300 [bacterium]